MAKLDKIQGRVPMAAEEVSSSSEDDDEVEEYFHDKVSEVEATPAEAVPPPLKIIPLSFGVQGKGKEKVVPAESQPSLGASQPSTGASSPSRTPVKTFDAAAALARARQLLLGSRLPVFGSGSAASASGESVGAAQKKLAELLQLSLDDLFARQGELSASLPTLLSSGVSSVEGLELSRLSNLSQTLNNYSMAKEDLTETGNHFGMADTLQGELSSALGTADEVMAMHTESRGALASAEAAVAELKAMLKQAIEHKHLCQKQADEHASILHDTSYQVDELARRFAEVDSKRLHMQTRRSEAEIRLQHAEAEWDAIRAAFRSSAVDQAPAPLPVVSAPIPAPASTDPVLAESVEDEVDRICREAERGDSLTVAALGDEFTLPVLDVANTDMADPSQS